MKPKIVYVIALSSLCLFPLGAEEPAASPSKEPAAETPKTAEVTSGELEVSLEFEGSVLPSEGEVVFYRPQAWSSLQVIDAMPHGTRVQKGQTVIAVDLEDLEKAIVDQQSTVEDLRIQIEESSLGLKKMKRDHELALEKARQALAGMQEDLERFMSVSVPYKKRDAEHAVDVAKRRLANELEELKQLTSMYEEDQLTEETEEIILVRQKNQVNDLRYALEKEQHSRDYTLGFIIPREIEDFKDAVDRSQRFLDDLTLDQQFQFTKEEQKHRALQIKSERAEQRLAYLLQDREDAAFQAPSDGIVFYGLIEENGVWNHSDAHKSLTRGGSLVARKPLYSIISDQTSLQLIARVELATVLKLRLGLNGYAGVKDSTALRTPIEHFYISLSPEIDGKYMVVAKLKPADFLRPNLNLTVTAGTVLEGPFTCVPSKAVKSAVDGSLEAHVQLEDGSFEKRRVVIEIEGVSQLTVKEGLEPGDLVKLND